MPEHLEYSNRQIAGWRKDEPAIEGAQKTWHDTPLTFDFCGVAAGPQPSASASRRRPLRGPTTTVNAQRQTIDVRQGTVVHSVGNNLVVKMQDGSVQHFVIPEDQTFDIDGKQVRTNDLKPGTRLMQAITTTTKDVTVSNIRNVDVRVIQVIPPHLNVQLSDGTQKVLTVPDGTVFEIDGKNMKLTDLREGMRIESTVVTKTPQTVVSAEKRTAGVAPVEIPTVIGIVLIDEKQSWRSRHAGSSPCDASQT